MYLQRNLDDLQTDSQEKWKINKPYFFCHTKIYTSGKHNHIIINCILHATTEGISNCSTTCCRGEPNLITSKLNDKYGQSHHIQNTYQFPNFHTRLKICRVGHWKLLPGNPDGVVGIYDNTHQINSTRHYHTLQLKWPSLSRWIDLHGKYTRNLRTTTSGHPCKQITRTSFNQPWILWS